MLIKNNTKKRWIILFIIILLSYLIGFIFRITWKSPSPEEVFKIFPLLSSAADKEDVFLVRQDNRTTIDTSSLSLNDLEEKADLIATGTVEEVFKVTRFACYYKVKIDERYKGNIGSEYFTYVVPMEIVNSGYNGNLMRMYLRYGVLPLHVGNSYIFLVEKIKFDPRTNVPNELQNSYFPIFKNALGVYDLNIDEPMPMQEGEVFLSDLPTDVVTGIVNYETLGIYNKFFEEVKNKYKNE